MKPRLFVLALMLFIVSGCASKAELIEMPEPPPGERDSVAFSVTIDPRVNHMDTHHPIEEI